MFTTRPELLGTFGFVTSTHWLASQAGMSMLEKGGNAFDAAVAAGCVLRDRSLKQPLTLHRGAGRILG
jgi:gamma-glutamyltranspeptidase/glutathione hydrolase